MADSLPPVPPPVPGSVPPVSPQPPVAIPVPPPITTGAATQPAVSPAVEDEVPRSNLSPFKLLAKKEQVPASPQANVVPPPTPVAPSPATTAPSAPTPAQPGQPAGGIMVATPSREELLKQAAEAPAASFILPPPEVIATQNSQATPLVSQVPRQPGAAMQPLLESDAPATPRKPMPTRQGALGTPDAPLRAQQVPFTPPKQMGAPIPLNGGVKPRIPGRVTPAVQNSLNVAAKSGFGTPVKKRNFTGTLIIGLLIFIIVGSGAAYVMAKNGSRVPVLFKVVSGLETSGLATNSQALSYVQARTRYQVQGEVELVRSDVDKSGKPTLSTAGDTAAGSVYRLKSQMGQGEFSEKGANHVGLLALTVNQNDPIQLALNEKPSTADADNWSMYFSSNDKPQLASIKSSLVAKSLLLPILQPIPLEKLLTLPTGELAYQKQVGTKAGTVLSAHKFTVASDKLKDYFPASAVLENFTLTSRYTWAQGATPAGQTSTADLEGKVTYLQKVYTFTAKWRYGSWDQPLDPSGDASGAITKVTGNDAPTPASMASATALMGILNLSTLPNTLTEAEGGSVTTGGSTGSAAVTPTGEGITVAGSRITTSPPVPTKPASAEAKARDTQRLKDLADIKQALSAYKTAKGSYPVSITLLQTVEGGVLLSELVSTYLTKLPIDPTKTTYWYEYTSTGSSFTLRAVAEDPESATVKKGSIYPYFEVTN